MDRKTKIAAAIAICCAIILSFLFYVGFLSNINLKLTDNLYGEKQPLDSITIVAIDDKSLQEIGRWPWNRTIFAKTIDFLNESRALGIDVAFFESSTTEQDMMLGEALSRAGNAAIPVEFTKFEKTGDRVIGKEMLQPVPELRTAKAYGYVNVVTDKDGVTRAVKMDVSDEYPAFANAVYEIYWGKKSQRQDSRFIVNFVGPPGSYAYYSLTDIYNERVDKNEFKDKLVLIGATSPDMHDDYFVPTSKGKAMPGVEVHANTIQTLINKDFLREQPGYTAILSIIISALLLTIIIITTRIRIATIAVPVLALAYVFFSIYIFNYGIIMNLIYVPLTIAITYTSEVLYLYYGTKKEKQQIKNAFGKYVSPQVLGEILKDPDKLKLGGDRKDITVFFSDIRGFTTISEGLTPEKLVHVLNEYLTAMTDIVMKHEGVVDKFIGDAIMAFWGAPLEQPEHAKMACLTSLEMMKELKKLQEMWRKEGTPEIKIGIGLNSGPAVIGNMGSYERLSYTAMGDTINLGSRLEGLTKQYGVAIIISENTKAKISNEFITRALDIVTVKGKKKPIKIYELVCMQTELTKEQKELIEHYEKGLELYLKRKWEDAIKEFKKANDYAAKAFIERCEEFKKSPPPKSWEGVWEFKTK